jgi:hypothetical protein
VEGAVLEHLCLPVVHLNILDEKETANAFQ